MFKKLLKKLLLATTLVCATGTVVAASGCNIETAHPEVKITVEFHENTYELEYTLYRNMYPNTVRHFMELTENGYYTDMLIHNYASSDWYSGGYYYDSESYSAATTGGAGAMSDYLEEHSGEQSYMNLFNSGKLTSTVYKFNPTAAVAEDALPTLIGEFSNNINQVIEQGALSASYGSLKMFYYEKTTNEKVTVTPTDDQVIMADYKTNCATSLFMIQVTSSSSMGAANYCVFGRLENITVLTDLTEAVREYLKTLTKDTVSANNVSVENDVEIFSEEDRHAEQDFVLPAEPIIIKSVKVTKY